MDLHRAVIRVFAKPEDDSEKVEQGLKKLVPIDFNKENIKINKKNAYGFNERKIVIMEIALKKQKHIKKFLEGLDSKLNDNQKRLIHDQADLRLDDDLCFFLRFDKEKLTNQGSLGLTNKGDCYHIKLSIAVFPRTRQNALEKVNSLF
jgi:RNA binding exosome subunit